MKNKHAVVITGGYSPEKEIIEYYLHNADYVIAADSGFDVALKNNIKVDFLIGDMDSVSAKEELKRLPEDKILIFSHEKDETDTELALNKAWDLGYTDNILIGGGGGRLDHMVGILWLFEREKHPKKWVTDNETVSLIEHTYEGDAVIGERISLFPLANLVEGLYSEGLKWDLSGLTWKRGDLGISNVATNIKIKIEVKKGKLLMIRRNKKGDLYG